MSETELQGWSNHPDDSPSESGAGQEQGGSRQTMGMGPGGDLAGSTTEYGHGVDRQGRPDDPGRQREDADRGNLNRNEADATPGSAGSSQSPTKGMKTTPLSGNLDQDVVE